VRSTSVSLPSSAGWERPDALAAALEGFGGEDASMAKTNRQAKTNQEPTPPRRRGGMQPPKRLVRSLPKVCRPLQLSNGVRTREQAGRRADRRGVAAIPEGTSKRWKRVAARVSDDKNGETEQHEEREG
jgi:hypothetical protein